MREGMHSGFQSELFRQNVQVAFQTQVWFTHDLFDCTNPVLSNVLAPTGQRPLKLLVTMEHELVATQPGITRRIAEYAEQHGVHLVQTPLLLAGGEAIKHSFDGVAQILEAIHLGDIDRHSYLLAIGGGAFLDASGLAGAIAHRGVRSIRVPTTVLSQNDSGVGVKNAINWFGKKNWLGTFSPPYAVLNDTSFLQTLPEREWRAGMAEAVKIALIRDAAFFRQLEVSAAALVGRSAEAMRELIHRCALGHMAHICEGGDPFEMGSARPLDHGHWSAHKLEAITGWQIRHGEAVAIGIALDAIYARRMGYLPASDCKRILALLTALGFALWIPELTARDTTGQLLIVNGLEEFRQHLGGELTITLLQAIGRGFEVHHMDAGEIAASLAELKDTALVAAA